MQGDIESVADYRILNGVITVVLLLGGAFMGVILPSASKVVALGDKEAQDRIAYDGTKYITITLCFCCFGMMSVNKEMLLLYVGSDYLYLSVWLDLWLLTTLAAHNQAISCLILSGSDIRAITCCTIVSSLIGLLVCWFLIPVFEVGGTVIAYGIYGLIQILFYYLYYWPKKMCINSVKVFRSSFFPSVFMGGVAMLSVRLGLEHIICLDNEWWNFLIKGFSFTLLYVLLVYVCVLNTDDKNFFFNLVKKHA